MRLSLAERGPTARRVVARLIRWCKVRVCLGVLRDSVPSFALRPLLNRRRHRIQSSHRVPSRHNLQQSTAFAALSPRSQAGLTTPPLAANQPKPGAAGGLRSVLRQERRSVDRWCLVSGSEGTGWRARCNPAVPSAIGERCGGCSGGGWPIRAEEPTGHPGLRRQTAMLVERVMRSDGWGL